MSLKKTILSVLSRDTLKALVDAFEVDAADRRSVDAMRAALSKSRKATPAAILESLSADEVREVAEEAGLGSKGTKAALIAELLAESEPRKEGPSADDSSEEPEARAERVRPLPDVPAGMLRVTRTELVWPGKYDESGRLREAPRVSLPFQVIERVNESRASREAEKAKTNLSLFDVYEGKEGETFEDGWRNKLIWGDNQLVMSSLLEKFAGKVDLVYIDPPFATGTDFGFTAEIGEARIDVEKTQSAIEEKAYRDTWGRGLDSYLEMLAPRLRLARELLATDGSLYLHIGPGIGPYVKALCDEVFGSTADANELVWKRVTGHSDSKRWGIVHDYVLWVTKGASFTWIPQFVPYSEEYLKSHYRYTTPEGRRYQLDNITSPNPRPNMMYEWRGHEPPRLGWRYELATMERLFAEGRIELAKSEGGRPRLRRFLDEMPGTPVGSVWDDIAPINSQAREDTGYDTQKPEKLLERVLEASSRPGALVADFFCGSGTTLAVAEKLGRRWIGCDLGRYAIHVTRKRLLDIEGCKPFEILNLGKYERRYWQVATFGEDLDGDGQIALYEYLAFVLKLYGAQPVSGLEHLHGKKGRAMVHVASVDAPVTISEVNAALEECIRVKQPELHVLGWEWEMGLNDLMTGEAKKQGVKLLLLQIPREVMEKQAAEKGDVTFFELAYLDAEIATPKKLTATVALREFVIPNSDLIPEDVRQKIRKWSDYIDYWAVDWDFRNDTFMQGWVTYRTRRDRTLELKSDPHTYPKAGGYTVMVKVVDIFGNDTSRTFRVEVR